VKDFLSRCDMFEFHGTSHHSGSRILQAFATYLTPVVPPEKKSWWGANVTSHIMTSYYQWRIEGTLASGGKIILYPTNKSFKISKLQ